jgi:hypothetical protein
MSDYQKTWIRDLATMNYTKSGIMACGAPHSIVRCKNEAQNAWDTRFYQSLLLTEEGRNIADRFFATIGCSPAQMPEEVKAESLNHPAVFNFLAGYLLAANHGLFIND